MTNPTDWGRDDRDLLVELRTEMKGVRADIKNLSDGNNARLTLLEQGKLDRTEANRLQSESLTVHANLDKRLKYTEEKIDTLETDAVMKETQTKTVIKLLAAGFAVVQLFLASVGLYIAYHFH